MNEGLNRLNNLSPEEAQAELLKCCGSTNWAQQVAALRPFRQSHDLMDVASRVWWTLTPQDWLEAFSRHPKIGEKRAARAEPTEASKWSEEEQSGTRGAPRETLAALAEANRAYESKFGYIFIVCATGKSSDQMLALLKERIQNEPGTELRIAAGEQDLITQLRLKKLLAQ